MNFLFVHPKYTYRGGFYHFNFGLAYVSSYTKHKGFKVSCLNLCHCDEPIERQLAECINSKKIDILCTGGMSINFEEVNTILVNAKKIKPQIITVVGGAIVSSDPRLALENMQIDFGVIGEGEETMAELAGVLSNGGNVGDIKGLAYFDAKNNLVITEERKPIENLDLLPFPDYEGFEYGYHLSTLKPNSHLYYHTILDEVRVGKVSTSRSCPFKCTFCYHQLGGEYRQRSLDNVFKEIDYLVEKYNINTLFLLDELFSIDKKRIYEFAERIKKYNFKWFPVLRVDSVDKELLKALKESGVYMISYGIENVNDEILKSMQKKTTRAQVEQALKLTREAGMGNQGGMLFGDPAETEETVKESIAWWKRHLNHGFTLSMIITLPDAPLYRYALARGLIKDKFQYMKDKFPLINLTRLSPGRFKKLCDFVRNCINDKRYIVTGKVVSLEEQPCGEPGKPQSSLFKCFNKKMFSMKAKCPECGNISEYKNMYYALPDQLVKYFPVLCRDCNALLWINTREAFFKNNIISGIVFETMRNTVPFLNKHQRIKLICRKLLCRFQGMRK
jgi:anaerobic magnesium-protoporphyrin IX monomethyl ester cyclase